MSKLSGIFELRTEKEGTVPLAQQRKRWLGQFMKTYSVLVVVYGGFYLLRTNFKSAQPFLQEQMGISTTELGLIGFGFSLVYGFGGLILGFFLDGKNAKKAISVLLIASGVVALAIGAIWGLIALIQAGY